MESGDAVIELRQKAAELSAEAEGLLTRAISSCFSSKVDAVDLFNKALATRNAGWELEDMANKLEKTDGNVQHSDGQTSPPNCS